MSIRVMLMVLKITRASYWYYILLIRLKDSKCHNKIAEGKQVYDYAGIDTSVFHGQAAYSIIRRN